MRLEPGNDLSQAPRLGATGMATTEAKAIKMELWGTLYRNHNNLHYSKRRRTRRRRRRWKCFVVLQLLVISLRLAGPFALQGSSWQLQESSGGSGGVWDTTCFLHALVHGPRPRALCQRPSWFWEFQRLQPFLLAPARVQRDPHPVHYRSHLHGLLAS